MVDQKGGLGRPNPIVRPYELRAKGSRHRPTAYRVARFISCLTGRHEHGDRLVQAGAGDFEWRQRLPDRKSAFAVEQSGVVTQ